eukprot:m.356150 g.356150  ORF g.356150 m.356150 type:complete len:749 (-) comp28017_c0_seq6:8435-10681(-)
MWHELPSCIDHIVCDRGLPGWADERLDDVGGLCPIESYLEMARGDPNLADDGLTRSLALGLSIQRSKDLRPAVAEAMKKGSPLVLSVLEHNVAIRFRPTSATTTELTAFELSTLRTVPMSTTRPITTFPTATAHIEMRWLATQGFLNELTGLMTTAPDDCKRTSKKDGEELTESREARSPMYFTRFLLPTLAAASSGRVPESGSTLPAVVEKTAHDSVLLSPGHNLPWRRSPVFTGLKAMLHVHCVASLGEVHGRIRYKMIMLQYLLFVWQSLEATLLRNGEEHGRAVALLVKMARRIEKLDVLVSAAGANIDELVHMQRCDIQARVTEAHRAANAAWSGPITLRLPSLESAVLETPIADLVNQRTLAGRLRAHDAAGQSTVGAMVGATPLKHHRQVVGVGGPPASGDETAASEDIVAHAEIVFDWVLDGHPLAGSDDFDLTLLKRCEKIAASMPEDPIGHSRRVLLGLAYFVRIDQDARRRHPMIGTFSTGVDPSVIQSLLLPSARWRKVAHILERTLAARYSTPGLMKVYEDFAFQKVGFAKYPKSGEFMATVEANERRLITEKLDEVQRHRDTHTELEARPRSDSNERSKFYCRVDALVRILPLCQSQKRVIAFEMTQPIELLKWREAAAFVGAVVLRKGYADSASCGHWSKEIQRRTRGEFPVYDPDDVDFEVQLCTGTKFHLDSHFYTGRNGKKYDQEHCTAEEDKTTGAPFVRNSGAGIILDDPVGDACPDLFTLRLSSTRP